MLTSLLINPTLIFGFTNNNKKKRYFRLFFISLGIRLLIFNLLEHMFGYSNCRPRTKHRWFVSNDDLHLHLTATKKETLPTVASQI